MPVESYDRIVAFSYHEHDWIDEAEKKVEVIDAMLRQATEGHWEDRGLGAGEGGVGLPTPGDDASLDDLVQEWESTMVGEWGLPADVVRVPVATLRGLMAEGGWTFGSGSFTEFEGHHNDTEILVGLIRPEPLR